MILFPNCKINLGLRVLRKREDGFHDLETIFYPLLFRDGLEIISQPEGSPTTVSVSGLQLDLNEKENICYKAWVLLQKDFAHLSTVSIHLHKCIPSGAGLGGGSADGAFTLLLLQKKFNLQIPPKKLLDYALLLGSDCPFFIVNSPCYATGRGEILEPVQLNLSDYKIAIVNPGIHISTAWAFSSISPQVPETSLKQIITKHPDQWRGNLKNDFEEPVMAAYPAIRKIRDQFYEMGAAYAAMTGTGSTVFGLFEKNNLPGLTFPEDYLFRWI